MIQPNIYSPETLPKAAYSRIVSLVPSLTETVAGLGRANLLVGRTRFCTSSPELLGHLPRIGGTKDPRIERIEALKPDLILAVREENTEEDIQALAKHYPCLVYDIQTLEDTIAMLMHLGQILASDGADDCIAEIENLRKSELLRPTPTCLYLIWKDPYMTIGTDTYINHMLTACGIAITNTAWRRYPTINNLEETCAQHSVDAILLSSEPYPFAQIHAQEISQETKLPVLLVDGQLLSWYGTLTPQGLRYGQHLQAQIAQNLLNRDMLHIPLGTE